ECRKRSPARHTLSTLIWTDTLNATATIATRITRTLIDNALHTNATKRCYPLKCGSFLVINDRLSMPRGVEALIVPVLTAQCLHLFQVHLRPKSNNLNSSLLYISAGNSINLSRSIESANKFSILVANRRVAPIELVGLRVEEDQQQANDNCKHYHAIDCTRQQFSG